MNDLNIKFSSENKSDRECLQLLYRLNVERDNRLMILKKMEKFFKEKRPRLSNQGASKLL